jgi:hypothetical protein
MACTRPMSHKGVLHDCPHQPGGLNSWHYSGSKQLAELSCKRGCEQNRNFLYRAPASDSSGEPVSYPYREFSRVFPLWETPSSAVLGDDPRLLAREYLFATFNEEVRLARDHESDSMNKLLVTTPWWYCYLFG